ncbi:MAG: isochorismatase family cysteine hydrolase [Verrucomicrobiota bacterium]
MMNSDSKSNGHTFGSELDPLSQVYRESIGDQNPTHFTYLSGGKTALLCIDLQYLDAAPGYGVFRNAESSGISQESQEYYFTSLEKTVLPNVRRLQDAFRLYQLEVIHTRIQSLTKDGRDRSNGHKRLNLHAAPGSREADFLEQIEPQGDELIINKTASGVFSSTNLHYVLKNVGINALFIVGVYTNECVETTVRDACDLGYLVTIVEDCCTTVTEELHQSSLTTLRDRYARIIDTQEALREIESYVSVKAIHPEERLKVH